MVEDPEDDVETAENDVEAPGEGKEAEAMDDEVKPGEEDNVSPTYFSGQLTRSSYFK